jgi:DNA-binding NarL/FixJ family response regulator
MTKRILIIEDETALQDAYALLFKTKKYEVFQAFNGEEALPILQNKKPDYVILDILMPVMGGVEFLETARIPEEYPDVKVLVLSNLSDPKTLETVLRLGASKYLLKASTSPRELIDAIESL